jgi:hypothetical protein
MVASLVGGSVALLRRKIRHNQQDRPHHPHGHINECDLATANAYPVGITAGPDGSIWFTEASAIKIGRITP